MALNLGKSNLWMMTPFTKWGRTEDGMQEGEKLSSILDMLSQKCLADF